MAVSVKQVIEAVGDSEETQKQRDDSDASNLQRQGDVEWHDPDKKEGGKRHDVEKRF